MEIGLTPQGHLRLIGWQDGVQNQPWLKAFSEDWCGGLFLLGAEKESRISPTLGFWQKFGQFVSRHLPAHLESPVLEPPLDAVWISMLLSAPPMKGGEYLSTPMFLSLWEALTEWFTEKAGVLGGHTQALHDLAPSWNQVGRLFFHLAENKNNKESLLHL
ncbi:MAG: hypothetical protein AAGJ35_09900 [Myxococcota bacterium]